MKRALIAWMIWLLSGVLPAAAQSGGTFDFIENKGQWSNDILYRADVSGSGFYLKRGGYTLTLYDRADQLRVSSIIHGKHVLSEADSALARAASVSPKDRFLVHGHTYAVRFLDANPNPQIVAEKPSEGYYNYFIGNDPSKWASRCRLYQTILYKDVYPGVDVRYFAEGGNLKYELVVHPGADLSQVRLEYDSVRGMEVRKNQLHVLTTVGETLEMAPLAYQPRDTGRSEVGCRYEVKGNVLRFRMEGYDRTTTLVIDPTLEFSTFTGSKADNWGFTATYGADGSMYLGGIADAGYPTTPGAFQAFFKGGNDSGIPGDIAIMKLNATGKAMLWATYIGGSDQDQPHSLIENASGDLVMAGRTESPDFPTTVAPVGPCGGWDIVVCELSPDGTQMLGSMKIGGTANDGVNVADYNVQGTRQLKQNYGDDARSEVNLDASGNIFVADCTQSSDFPIVGGAFQTALSGAQDGLLLKINPSANAIIWSTFIGGGGYDAAYVVAMNPLQPGSILLGGGTTSSNFPGIGAGVVQPTFAGGTCDGFLAILTDAGSSVSIQTATYIGTTGIDQVYGVQYDKFGFPYIMGTTTGNWPVINAAFSNTDAKQFIVKLQPDLSAYIYSTVFGSLYATVPNISPVAFLVDRCENVYVSGWGGKVNQIEGYQSAGTAGMPITPNPVQPNTDGSNFYFFVLKKDAASQLYGSYFGQIGGNFADHVDGGTSRYDKNGVIYQGICANCGGGAIFPTGPGKVWSNNNGSNGQCNEVGVKIAFNLAGVSSGEKATIVGRPNFIQTGCTPMQVDFTDTVGDAKQYYWDFGDGSPQVMTTVPVTSHSYPSVGTYIARLISVDSTTCNIADTSYVTLVSRNNSATLLAADSKVPPCQSLTYQFNNNSLAAGLPGFTDSSFVWNFGDSSAPVYAGTGPVQHTFPSVGVYTVTLSLVDTNFCDYPMSDTLSLRVSPEVKAAFSVPSPGCLPFAPVFVNNSLGGQQFYWNFGDGATSNQENPAHTFTRTGTFIVQLIAVDSSTCNISDTTTDTVTVVGAPTAAFAWNPKPSEENTPTVFTNNSSADATSFIWYFGDGDSLATGSRDTVSHQYVQTGSYDVCLLAVNNAGCSDSVCGVINAIVTPALDVPNAFTPGRFGADGIIKVRGYGIKAMDWKIFNRWGQVVFETDDVNTGWDGTFKGVPQPMDVYAYTLKAEFSDGTRTTKTGDITLLR